MPPSGVKPKNLLGIPWRAAFALQADGWWLRSDVIWQKPNPMPESIADRPTKAHEYVFLLAKSERYFYDAEAVREPAVAKTDHDATGPGYHAPGQPPHEGSRRRAGRNAMRGQGSDRGRTSGRANREGRDLSEIGDGFTRNRRSVWTVATQPYHGAHFATMPTKLVEPCVLAGSAPGDVVLDPFAGSGTVGAVALTHGRRFVGCELNETYAELARERIAKAVADAAKPTRAKKPRKPRAPVEAQGSLFDAA